MIQINILRIKNIIRMSKEKKIGSYASQTAFFVILSAIPFAILFFSMLKLLPIEEEKIFHVLKESFKISEEEFLRSIVQEIYEKSVGILSFAVITALWSSSKGVHYLVNGLNEIYEAEIKDNYIWNKLRAMGLTLGFAFGIIILTLFLMMGSEMLQFLETVFSGVFQIVNMLLRIRYVLFGVIVGLLFWFALYFLPDKKIGFVKNLYPAVCAASIWVILSAGLGMYVKLFNGFSMYGSMTTIILLFMWIYIGIYILLLAAAINYNRLNKQR